MGWRRAAVVKPGAAPYDPACPFCPGNERMLPTIIAETPREAAPGWQLRVVTNKYPALSPDGMPRRVIDGAHIRLSGFGYHEVIVESPRHDADLTSLSDLDIGVVVAAYRARFKVLAAREHIRSVVVFRNHGGEAGASLVHPHSQVIAAAMVPPKIAAAVQWARARFAETGCCAMCQDIRAEVRAKRRVVEVTEHFLTSVPFAAASPFEIRIVPLRHCATFAATDAAELADFGAALRRALLRLKLALDDPSYNFMIESATPGTSDAPSSHWCLKIVPGLVTPAGFELASGIRINPSEPEVDAKVLRSVAVERRRPSAFS